MNKKQIARFLKKVEGEADSVPFSYHYPDDDIFLCSVVVTSFMDFIGYEIFINRTQARKFKDPDRLKMALMHEIGHFKTNAHLIPQKSVREYKAQEWAINRAKELGMTRLERKLKIVLEDWGKEKWNGRLRYYIMASKLAKKNGLI